MIQIGHGAQARVYLYEKEHQKYVIKERLPKKYRHPDLDKQINESRIRSEAKILEKLFKKGVRVPQLLKLSIEDHRIHMSYVQGLKLKDYLNNKQITKQKIMEVLQKIGKIVHSVHSLGIIHGDLTTSNMIIQQNQQIYLIDFGLSYNRVSIEDRAVDLYVLERAFISTHPQLQKQFEVVLESYAEIDVLKRLEVVRQRGRKKIAFG